MGFPGVPPGACLTVAGKELDFRVVRCAAAQHSDLQSCVGVRLHAVSAGQCNNVIALVRRRGKYDEDYVDAAKAAQKAGAVACIVINCDPTDPTIPVPSRVAIRGRKLGLLIPVISVSARDGAPLVHHGCADVTLRFGDAKTAAIDATQRARSARVVAAKAGEAVANALSPRQREVVKKLVKKTKTPAGPKPPARLTLRVDGILLDSRTVIPPQQLLPEALRDCVAVRARVASEGTVAVCRKRGKYDNQFLETAREAQRTGALAVVVVNFTDDPNITLTSQARGCTIAHVRIPVIAVGLRTGCSLLQQGSANVQIQAPTNTTDGRFECSSGCQKTAGGVPEGLPEGVPTSRAPETFEVEDQPPLFSASGVRATLGGVMRHRKVVAPAPAAAAVPPLSVFSGLTLSGPMPGSPSALGLVLELIDDPPSAAPSRSAILSPVVSHLTDAIAAISPRERQLKRAAEKDMDTELLTQLTISDDIEAVEAESESLRESLTPTPRRVSASPREVSKRLLHGLRSSSCDSSCSNRSTSSSPGGGGSPIIGPFVDV